MFFREATVNDIEKMHYIQTVARANNFSTLPGITPEDYQKLIKGRGKGWVCELDDNIVGCAMVNVEYATVWSLFVLPEHEGNFIGRTLHDIMTSWCFARGLPKLIITTPPGSRAEQFCAKSGWVKTGTEPNGDLRFELENNLEPRNLY